MPSSQLTWLKRLSYLCVEGRQLWNGARGRGRDAGAQISTVHEVVSNAWQVGQVGRHVNLGHLAQVRHVEVVLWNLQDEVGYANRVVGAYPCTAGWENVTGLYLLLQLLSLADGQRGIKQLLLRLCPQHYMGLCDSTSQGVQEDVLFVPTEVGWKSGGLSGGLDPGPHHLSHLTGAVIRLCGRLLSHTRQTKWVSPGCRLLCSSVYLSRSRAPLKPSPATRLQPCLLAVQVLSGVEEQQGADRADVAGQTPKPLLGLILRLRLGDHTHGEVLQLLLGMRGGGRGDRGMLGFSTSPK